jgi:hypothetical protein
MKRSALLIILVLAGCTLHKGARIDDAAMRTIVLAHLRSEDAQIAGPMRKMDRPDEGRFKKEDAAQMRDLFSAGVIGYAVYRPDYHTIAHDAEGKAMHFIMIDRIVMIRGSAVVAEFFAL